MNAISSRGDHCMVEDSRSSISNAPASSSSDSSITDKERLTILWNEYKDQADWQRHNEVQRASLSNIMLVISAALIAFSQRDPSSRTIPLFLIVIGVFGVIAVSKYWERFMYHVHQQRHLRRLFSDTWQLLLMFLNNLRIVLM